MFATGSSAIYGDARGQRMVGTLTPATALQVSGRETNDFRAFTLNAWCRQDDTTTLVVSEKQRIVLAVITGGVPDLKTLSTVKDDYGTVWNKVATLKLIGLFTDGSQMAK